MCKCGCYKFKTSYGKISGVCSHCKQTTMLIRDSCKDCIDNDVKWSFLADSMMNEGICDICNDWGEMTSHINEDNDIVHTCAQCESDTSLPLVCEKCFERPADDGKCTYTSRNICEECHSSVQGEWQWAKLAYDEEILEEKRQKETIVDTLALKADSLVDWINMLSGRNMVNIELSEFADTLIDHLIATHITFDEFCNELVLKGIFSNSWNAQFTWERVTFPVTFFLQKALPKNDRRNVLKLWIDSIRSRRMCDDERRLFGQYISEVVAGKKTYESLCQALVFTGVIDVNAGSYCLLPVEYLK